MGNCFHCCEARGPESDADAEISLKDKSVQKKEKKTHRVLLLGPGDSGKTTLLNQMRKLHGSIRSDNSIDTIKDVIKTNIVKYMAILTAKSKEFGIELSSNDNYQYAQLVLEYAMSMENSKLSNFDSRDDMNMSMNMNMNGNNNDLNLNTSLNRRFVNSYKNVPSNIINAIKILWNDDGIKECLNNRYKYQIDDNVGYFFDSIDRVFDESFDPSDEDILRLRMRTTGFGEQTFQVYFEKPNFKNKDKNNKNNNNNVNNNNNDGSNNNNNNNDDNNNMNSNENSQYTLRRIKPNESLTAEEEKKKEKFVFIDVGGQRSERRKWMNVMMGDQSIQAVLYLVAISEFDLTCFEDHSTRRLDEAMNLFKECAMKGILDDKTVSIFFNKYDLFEEKLKDKRINFRDYYPEYTNDIRNESEIVEFVANKFKRIYYERFDTPNTNNSGNTNTNNTNGNNLYNLRLKPTISNSNNTNSTMNNINVNSNNNNNNNSKNNNSNYGTLNSATPNSPLSTSHTNNINNNNNNNNGNKNNRMGLNGKQSTKVFLQNHNELGVDRVNSTESTMESKFAENSELNGKEHSDVISHSQTNDTMLDAFSSRVYSDSDTFFFHCTCALDTKQIETIMKDIQIKLISKNFKQVGFM